MTRRFLTFLLVFSVVANIGVSANTAEAGTRAARENRHTFHELYPGINGSAWRCVNKLWTRESGWQHLAVSGPIGGWNTDYGIPQMLLRGWSRSEIDAWRHNPARQEKSGVRYIRSRFGSMCAAWNHETRYGWY